MKYTYLPSELHQIADTICLFLKEERGIKKINIEKSIDRRIYYCPTLSGMTNRGYLICVEISPDPYPLVLDSFVVDCIRYNLPVKLFVANPEFTTGKYDQKASRRACSIGVGNIIVTNGSYEVIREPLELSLTLPEVDVKKYPIKFRAAISDSITTYKNGNPVKGVSDVCDLIEEIIRNVAKKAKKIGKIPHTNKLNLDKDSLGLIHNSSSY